MAIADIEAKLDAAVAAFKKTTASYPQMVKSYGSDPSRWPTTSYWYQGFQAVAAARAEVAGSAPPKAAFSFREV